MTTRTRLSIVIVLAILGASLSGLLLLEHHGESLASATVDALCGEGNQSGCDTVNRSAYSQVAGMPLAAIGLVFCLSLALLLGLSLLASDAVGEAAGVLALGALALALAVDVVLLGIQAFAIRAFCKLCLATYVVNAASLLLLLPLRREARTVKESLRGGEARLALAGWAAATLAVGAAVASAEGLLAAREAQRIATLLGSPVRETPALPPASTPAPPAAPSAAATPTAGAVAVGAEPAGADADRYRDEARAAQEQARRLQEILDDPQKLQKYLEEKAAREFDTAPAQTFDLSKTPSEGPSSASIRIVTFSDFLCPWCRNLAQGLSGFLPQSGGRVTLYFKHYPLDQTCNDNLKGTVHAGACGMALGGICAHEQGHFWQYHDKVFESTFTNPTRDDVVKVAGDVGLNVPAFESCLASPRAKERLAAEIQEGRRVSVSATPTVFINGKKLPNLNSFMLAIDKESKRLGLPPLAPPQAK
jgi:protein-disulfide isomerase/uncharacterized membrane protein